MTPEQIRNELDQDEPRSSFPQYFMQSRQDRDAELWAYDQMSREVAQNRTLTAPEQVSGPTPHPDAEGASEALVQQIAEAIESQCQGLAEYGYDWTDAARAVLPLVEAQVAARTARILEHAEDAVAARDRAMQRRDEEWNRAEAAEAQVAPLRDEVDRLRGLVGDEDQPGWDGCSRAEAIRQANEFHAGQLRWIDEHDKRRDERDAAESALRQVRELADEWSEGDRPDWWHGFVAELHRTLAQPHDCSTCSDCIHDGRKCCGCYDGVCCKVSARVGAADTQPEGTGDVEAIKREAAAKALTDAAFDLDIPNTQPHTREDSIGAAGAPDWLRDRAAAILRTPTAGGKVDTAPEAYYTCGHSYRQPGCGWPCCGFPDRPADTAPESGEGR